MQTIVFEKHSKIRDLLNVNGLSSKNYLVSNFIYFFSFIFLSISLFFISGYFLLEEPLFQNMPKCLVIIFITIWTMSLTSFSIFLSETIDKPEIASTAGYLIALPINLFFYLVNLQVYPFPGRLPFYLKICPIVHLSRSLGYIMIQANDKMDPDMKNEFLESMIILFLTSIIFLIMTIYYEKLSSFSLKKAILKVKNTTIKYIFKSPMTNIKTLFKNTHESSSSEELLICNEIKTQYEKYSIVCKSISKVYLKNNKDFYALKDVFLRVRKGEVLCLLGPNGAGKTTLMSILTGMKKQSSGDFYINGKKNEEAKNQTDVSICPQFDILWPYLTVYQHLLIFCKFRNVDEKDIDRIINEILENTSLELKKNVIVDKLSGGMKRRVALTISLIGNTKIVFLDEPTTGLDPSKRIDFWKIIRS